MLTGMVDVHFKTRLKLASYLPASYSNALFHLNATACTAPEFKSLRRKQRKACTSLRFWTALIPRFLKLLRLCLEFDFEER